MLYILVDKLKSVTTDLSLSIFVSLGKIVICKLKKISLTSSIINNV